MRINRLKISSKWKNLEGFCIDFDEPCDVTVLIGRNGTAKTNLAEALISIFSKLNLNKPAPFSYELDYKINGHQIRLNGIDGKTPTVTVDGKKVSATVVREQYSPRYVVGYYSGTSDRFRELFVEHDRLALKKTLIDSSDNEKLDLSSFICARPIHGLFSLLAFYYSDDEKVCRFLEKLPRIEAFDSLLIVLNKPSWAKSNADADDFWGARGPVRDLLEAIKRHSLVPFSRTERTKIDFRRHETKEFLYLYLPDLQALQALAKEYGKDPGALFQALDTMRLSEFIDESSFRVKVKVKGSDDSIHTRQFRPKGRVVEIDNSTYEKTGDISHGYWWLAFEPKNYRLSCMHSNQRRVDEYTEGGKWDFFPVEGVRAPEGTEWDLIEETVLPFDPCSGTDMALLWFSSDGTPTLRNSSPSDEETRRLKITIWLFHLDKKEIAQKRRENVIDIYKDIKAADAEYKLWQNGGAATGSVFKTRFDGAIAKIKSGIRNTMPFARARQCAVLLSKSEYPWIGKYIYAG